MTQPFDEYADAREQKPPENIMQELEATVLLLIKQDAEVEQQEEVLKQVKAKRNGTRFKDLPEVMKRAGNLLEYKLELPNGMEAVVERSKDTGGALSKGNRQYVLEFMVKNGYGMLIDNDIIMPFSAAQHAEMEAASEKLRAAGLAFTVDKTVQSSRYSAFCARMVDASKITPDSFSLFGIHIVEQATVKVKPRKVRKGRAGTAE